MTEKYQKPLSIVWNEFLKDLVELVNNSHLPPFMIEIALKDVYSDVKNAAKTQLELDYKRQKEYLNRELGEQHD